MSGFIHCCFEFGQEAMVDTHVMQHHSSDDYFTTFFRTITESPSCSIHGPPTTLPNTEGTLNCLTKMRKARLYLLCPGVAGEVIGVIKLGRNPYALSPKSHPWTVSIPSLVISRLMPD